MEFENLKEIEFNEGVRIKVEKGGKGSSGKGGRGVCPARHSTGVDSIDPWGGKELPDQLGVAGAGSRRKMQNSPDLSQPLVCHSPRGRVQIFQKEKKTLPLQTLASVLGCKGVVTSPSFLGVVGAFVVGRGRNGRFVRSLWILAVYGCMGEKIPKVLQQQQMYKN